MLIKQPAIDYKKDQTKKDLVKSNEEGNLNPNKTEYWKSFRTKQILFYEMNQQIIKFCQQLKQSCKIDIDNCSCSQGQEPKYVSKLTKKVIDYIDSLKEQLKVLQNKLATTAQEKKKQIILERQAFIQNVVLQNQKFKIKQNQIKNLTSTIQTMKDKIKSLQQLEQKSKGKVKQLSDRIEELQRDYKIMKQSKNKYKKSYLQLKQNRKNQWRKDDVSNIDRPKGCQSVKINSNKKAEIQEYQKQQQRQSFQMKLISNNQSSSKYNSQSIEN